MTIATIEYRGYELRAYSHQEFPLHRDPYAKGATRFSSVVRIESMQPGNVKPQRYGTVFTETAPSNATDAIDLAMRIRQRNPFRLEDSARRALLGQIRTRRG